MSTRGQLWAHSARTDVLDSLCHRPMTFRELREDTGSCEPTLRRSLYALRDRGLVTASGGDVTVERGATAKTWAITPAGIQTLEATRNPSPRRQAPKATPMPPPAPDESSTSQGPEEAPAEKPERRPRRRGEDPLTLDEAAVALWLAANAVRARRVIEQVRRYWDGVAS